MLFFGSDFALDFLYVFGSRKVLGTDASRSKHLTDCAVVLDVLGGDGGECRAGGYENYVVILEAVNDVFYKQAERESNHESGGDGSGVL